MTISALGVRAVYAGSDSVGPFTLEDADSNPILFENDSEIAAWHYDSAGSATLLTLTTDYTLTGAGEDSAGDATLVEELASGETLVLIRETPLLQDLDLTFGGAFSLQDLEETLDEHIRIMQELDERLDRALLLPITTEQAVGALTLPEPSGGKVLAWNSGGTAIINSSPPLFFVQNSAPDTDEPASSLWIDADSADGDLYQLTSGAWSDTGVNLRGPQGDQGASGDGTGDVIGPISSTDNAVVRYNGAAGTSIQDSGVLIDDSNNLVPATTNTGALGTVSLQWEDLHLASGGVLNWSNGNVTITHAAGTLTFAGASSGYRFGSGPLVPSSDDGAALGTTSLKWSDLHLASGGVLNWNNGNFTVTHSAGLLTFSGNINARVPLNSQTGTSYTLVLGDANGIVTMTNGSSNELTIPSNASVSFPVGTVINVVMGGSGVTIITAASGVTLNGASAGSGAIQNQFQGISLLKTATNTWIASGDIGAVA